MAPIQPGYHFCWRGCLLYCSLTTTFVAEVVPVGGPPAVAFCILAVLIGTVAAVAASAVRTAAAGLVHTGKRRRTSAAAYGGCTGYRRQRGGQHLKKRA